MVSEHGPPILSPVREQSPKSLDHLRSLNGFAFGDDRATSQTTIAAAAVNLAGDCCRGEASRSPVAPVPAPVLSPSTPRLKSPQLSAGSFVLAASVNALRRIDRFGRGPMTQIRADRLRRMAAPRISPTSLPPVRRTASRSHAMEDTATMEERIVSCFEQHLSGILRRFETLLTPPERGCFSVSEAAEFVRCSEDHIRRHIKGGTLPVANIGMEDGPDYRILRADLLDWLQKRKTGAIPPPRRKPKKTTPAVSPYQSRHHKRRSPSPAETHAA